MQIIDIVKQMKENDNYKFLLLQKIISFVFSIFQTIGVCIYRYTCLNVTTYFSNGWMDIIAIFCLSFVICYFVLGLFIKYMLKDESSEGSCRWLKKIIDILMSKPCLYSFIIISIAWLPWIIAYYPGSIFYDMSHQLAQYYGKFNIQTHPPFSTMIMGWCMDFGKNVFVSDNIGLFIYVILQFVVCAYACSQSLALLKKINTPKILWFIILVFYSIFPLYGACAQCAMKDTLNYGLTLLVAVQAIKWFCEINEKCIRKRTISLYIIYCFLSCLYRKEMVYVYILVTIVINIYMLFVYKDKKVLIVLAVSVISIWFSNYFTNEIISKGYFGQEFAQGDAESLSIPLQQVARYVTYYGDEITDEEKQIIGECFNYGYDGIIPNYNPNISDPIKYNFNVQKSKENGFWKVYLSLLKRKPSVFIESILASGYGYFSVVPNVPATVNNAPTNGLPGGRISSTYINLGPVEDTKEFWVQYKESTEKFRTSLNHYAYAFQVPYNFLYSFGFYSWMTLTMLLLVVIKRGISKFIPYLLAVLLILVCVASPVNDYGRYYMSVIYIFPLLVGVTKKFLTRT